MTPSTTSPSAPSSASAQPAPQAASPKALRLRRAGGRRDLRLAAGVALVVAAVVLGGRVLASAGDRVEVWALASSLAAGTTLTSDDLVAVPVALDDVGAYLPAGGSDGVPAGRVLLRDVASGELLPAAAVGEGDGDAARRLVTVPVDPLHAPPGLARGERVDVWVTPADTSGAGGAAPVLLLSGALVADPGSADASGLTDQVGVVLDVALGEAPQAVSAARAGDVDLVRVGG